MANLPEARHVASYCSIFIHFPCHVSFYVSSFPFQFPNVFISNELPCPHSNRDSIPSKQNNKTEVNWCELDGPCCRGQASSSAGLFVRGFQETRSFQASGVGEMSFSQPPPSHRCCSGPFLTKEKRILFCDIDINANVVSLAMFSCDLRLILLNCCSQLTVVGWIVIAVVVMSHRNG